MIWFFLWLGCAVMSSIVAGSKRRNKGDWFLLGFLFGPLAFIAILAIGEPLEPSRETPLPAKPKGVTMLAVIFVLFAVLVYLSMTVG